MRKLLAITVAAAVALALAWALWPRPVSVETSIIGRHSIDVTVDEEGKSRIRDVFVVSAPIAGTLGRMGVHAGDKVTEAISILASIRPMPSPLLDKRSRLVAQATADAAKAAVDLAAAQVRQADTQANFLKSEKDRAESLVNRGAVSERAFDKAVVDAAVADADRERARANLVVQKQQYESALAVISQDLTGSPAEGCCVDIKAPVSGEVLRVITESEQAVQPGTPLIEIGNTQDVEIVTDILSRDAVRVAVGNNAQIDGWGGVPMEAQVTSVSPAAVTKISALGIEEQRVAVLLKLQPGHDEAQRLGHGFRVSVHIVIWHGESVLAVPVGALFRTGPDWSVFVMKDGRAQLRRLELGQRNADWVEIKSGLLEGDQVIMHPSDTIADGARVQIG